MSPLEVALGKISCSAACTASSRSAWVEGRLPTNCDGTCEAADGHCVAADAAGPDTDRARGEDGEGGREDGGDDDGKDHALVESPLSPATDDDAVGDGQSDLVT